MKKIIRSIVIIAILVSAIGAQAQDDFEKNMYVSYDVGAVFQQDANVSQSFGSNGKVSFYPGARLDVGIGYNFCNWLAADVSGGFMWNSINTFNGVSLSSINQDVNIYSFPILVGLTLKLPNRTHFIPYVGVSGGANISEFYLSDNGTSGNDHDVEPALQAEAGLNYVFNPSASLGLDYKFMTTLDQQYHINGNSITQSGIYIHGIFIDLSVNF
ncbi:MAG TPA: outer membrane beta-barrel protein [Pseudomonadales bacterium]|nr:outer membrane beta-barrel protein [Pseudomonadales bacterium]